MGWHRIQRCVIAVWWVTLQHASPSIAPLSPFQKCPWALFCPCEPVTVKASGGTFNKPMLLCMLEDVTHAKAGNAESAALHAVDPSSLICLCAIGCQNISWAIGLLEMTACAELYGQWNHSAMQIGLIWSINEVNQALIKLSIWASEAMNSLLPFELHSSGLKQGDCWQAAKVH